MTRVADAAASIRLPKELLARLEKLAARLGGGVVRVSRSEVIRTAIQRGVEVLEREVGKVGKRKK